MASSMMVSSWSNKVLFSSRKVIAEGCYQEKVILTKENIACFCLSQRSFTALVERVVSLLSIVTK